MDNHAAPTLADQLAAAQDWWRVAGVDCNFSDEAQSWLTEPETPAGERPRPVPQQQAPAPPPEPVIRIGGEIAALPQSLAAFRTFWLEEPSLDAGGSTPRIAPRGPAGAPLMVLVPEPEAKDCETLLSGPQGQLLGAMLAAMGIAGEDCYVASALPRHTPLADWAALQRGGLGDVLQRHIALAAPARLLVFGASILPLLGHDPAQDPQSLREFHQESGSIPLLAARNLAVLSERPGERARFWRRWLDWTETGA